MRARSYCHGYFRFLTPDPVHGSIDNMNSLNHYTYAEGDPVNKIDPSGLLPMNNRLSPTAYATTADGLNGGLAYINRIPYSTDSASGSPTPIVYAYTYADRERTGCTTSTVLNTGRVFIYQNVTEAYFEDPANYPEDYDPEVDLLIGDFTHRDNPTMYAYQAHKIPRKAREAIVTIMLQYVPTRTLHWGRTKESLLDK